MYNNDSNLCGLTSLVDQKNSDRMIKQLLLLLNSVGTKYHNLSVSHRLMIC